MNLTYLNHEIPFLFEKVESQPVSYEITRVFLRCSHWLPGSLFSMLQLVIDVNNK